MTFPVGWECNFLCQQTASIILMIRLLHMVLLHLLVVNERKAHQTMKWCFVCVTSHLFAKTRSLIGVRLTQGTEWKSWRTDKSACEQNTVLSGKARSNISCNQSTAGFLVRRSFLTTFKNAWRKNTKAVFCPTPCFSYRQ